MFSAILGKDSVDVEIEVLYLIVYSSGLVPLIPYDIGENALLPEVINRCSDWWRSASKFIPIPPFEAVPGLFFPGAAHVLQLS